MPVVSLPGQDWITEVGPVSGLELVAWEMDGAPPRADEIRFVVPPYMGAAARIPALSQAPRVEVVQLLSAGYDDVLSQLPPGVRLANAAGVHDASTAELAVALTLASLRGLPEFVAAQAIAGGSRCSSGRPWLTSGCSSSATAPWAGPSLHG